MLISYLSHSNGRTGKKKRFGLLTVGGDRGERMESEVHGRGDRLKGKGKNEAVWAALNG